MGPDAFAGMVSAITLGDFVASVVAIGAITIVAPLAVRSVKWLRSAV